jgi:hypothetical protein
VTGHGSVAMAVWQWQWQELLVATVHHAPPEGRVSACVWCVGVGVACSASASMSLQIAASS